MRPVSRFCVRARGCPRAVSAASMAKASVVAPRARANRSPPAARAVYRALRRAWLPGTALACSGGHDSTALLLLAVDARRAGAVGDFVAFHVDHGVRADSDADARLVAELCRANCTPYAQVTLGWATDTPQPGEDELRRRRYAALAQLTRRLGLSAVMTAHTRADQVETVLMRLLSGAAPLGAAGMRGDVTLPTEYGALRVLRPLLEVSRADLDVVLSEHNIVPRHDPSNDDSRYRRNAMRNDVLPTLRAAYPGFDAALLRSVALAARDAALADTLAQQQLPVVTACGVDDTRTINRAWLRVADPALATRVLRLALRPLLSADAWRELTFERIEAVRRAADGRCGARIELPGGVVAVVAREQVALQGGPMNAKDDNAELAGES
jgi:tRNA(Ile)-lysidine synthase